MEGVKVKDDSVLCEGSHWCPSCKVRVVADEYRRCAGCQRKWLYVYDSCVKAGWPDDLARCKANDSYPEG